MIVSILTYKIDLYMIRRNNWASTHTRTCDQPTALLGH